MSKELDKQTLIRLAWTTALRRSGDRDICAMQLLKEITGSWRMTFTDVGALAGLNGDQVYSVIYMFDGRMGYRKHSFAEIAGVIEDWFRA